MRLVDAMVERRFYRLVDDMLLPARWHLGEVQDAIGFEPVFDAGVRCFGVEPLTVDVTHSGSRLDFTLTSFNVPIASQGLAEAISPVAGPNLEFVPVRIENQTNFAVLNALCVLPCLDEKCSEFIKWTEADHRPDLAGQYRQVTKLRLNPQLIPPDTHLFRIKGWLVALIVSDEVKRVMEERGCRGAEFLEVTVESQVV